MELSKRRTVGAIVLAVIVAFCVGVIMLSLKLWQPQPVQKRVAVITKSTTSEFWQAVKRGVETAAAELNISFTFSGPTSEEDVARQNEIIDEAIASKVDAIVLSGISYTGANDAVERAFKKGIPIIVFDSDIQSNSVTTRVMTDSVEAGRKAALKALTLTKGDEPLVVGLINYDVSSQNGQQREQGTREVFKELDVHYKNSGGKEGYCTKVYPTVNVSSNVDSAQKGLKKLLEAHPDINTIITYNEWTTLGVGFGVRNMELADKISIIGFDNNVECVNMLETGVIDALVVQNPFAMGYLAIEHANNAITNRLATKVPLVQTEVGVISRDNMFASENQKLLFPLK